MIEVSAILTARPAVARPSPAAMLTARVEISPPRAPTLIARAEISPPPPPTLTARTEIPPPPAPMLTARGVLHGEVQQAPVEVTATLGARASLTGQGVRVVPASAALSASPRLTGAGVRRVPAQAFLAARTRLLASGELVPDPRIGTIEAALRTYLFEDPAITSLIGDRIYTLIAPDHTLAPLVTLYVTFEKADQILRGRTNRYRASVTLTAWATDTADASGYTTMRALAERLRERLVGARFRRGRIEVQAIVEEGLQIVPPSANRIASLSLDLSVTYHRL